MTRAGTGQQSDQERPWPRRRAVLWVAVCAVLGVAVLVVALLDGTSYLLLLIPSFTVWGVQTARRLRQSRTRLSS